MVGLVAAALVVAVGAGHAAGQTTTTTTNPYPGGCTTLVSASSFGSAPVGSTITLTLQPTCVWTANSAVEVVVNGQSVGTKIANASGFVTVVITVVDDETLSIDDPVFVDAICGINTVVGRGTSTVAGGNVVTHQATFTVVCEDEDEDENGEDVEKAKAQPPAQRLSLTGANVSRWLAIALVAIVGGSVFLVAGRRRKLPSSTL